MNRRKIHRNIVLIFILSMIGGALYAQPSSPRVDYSTLEGGINTPVTPGSSVCPSLDLDNNGLVNTSVSVGAFHEVSSTSNFSVLAVTEDVGDLATNTFEWVVYGGWITAFNGSPVSANNQRTAVGDGNIRYSYYSGTGTVDVAGLQHSLLTVEWDTTNHSTVNAWVAVRQSSQFACSNDQWSVFTNNIVNQPPTISFPVADPDILLGYNQRNNFSLPLPNYSDGTSCSGQERLFYRVYRPLSGMYSNTYNASDLSSLLVNLDDGTNRVVWIISDGALADSVSFNIIVDTAIAIERIGWNNPSCYGGNDGRLYAHDIMASALLPASAFTYRLNGGTPQAENLFSDLIAGVYTVQMQVTYADDIDWDGGTETFVETTPAYSITLHDRAQQAVGNIPGQNGADPDDPGLLVGNTGCSDGNDGSIEVSPLYLPANNSSLRFNNSTYLPLNVSYTEEMGAISVAAWVKVNTGYYGPIVSFDENAYFQLRVTTDNNAPVAFEVPSGSVTSNQRISDNKWHFVVGVFDGTAPNKLTIYIDGVPTRAAGPAAATIGNALATRYGYIGRRADSNSTKFNGTTSSTNFVGQIADVAIFKNNALDSVEVDGMFRAGFNGATNRWVLDNTRTSLPADAPFTDLMGSGAPDEYARFITEPAVVPNDAPITIDWTDTIGEASSLTLTNLAIGTYTLNIRDQVGCGLTTETYAIGSNDNVPPIFLANLALFSADVTQSSTQGSNRANLAVDGKLGSTGYSETNTEATPWWQVRLATNALLHVVRIYARNPMTNFEVHTSQDMSTWFEVATYTGAASDYFEFLVNGTLGRNGAYLRIRSTSASDSLAFREVEVWGETSSVTRTRNFYLGNPECNYTINTAIDGSVDPLVWDACQGATAVWSNGVTTGSTIDATTLTLGSPFTVTWTATDNQEPTPNTSSIQLTYALLDTIRPWFVTVLPNDTTSITWCDAQLYDAPIPDVSDNNWCNGNEQLQSLTLSVGGYTYTANNFNGVGVIRVAPEALTEGYRNLVWTVTDLGGLSRRDTVRVYVQTRPAITGIEKTNISCNTANDGQISIWRINRDASATSVEYLLSSGGAPTAYPDNFISGLSDAQYTVSIRVNGCESAPASYGGLPYVEILRPLPTNINPTFIAPQCFGDTDGQISLTTEGGDAGNSLHFPGDGGLATALNLPGVTIAGTVEAWVYFDTLTTGINNNAVFISKGSDFSLGLNNSILTLVVGGATIISDVTNQFSFQEKTWYHVAATWSATGSNLYVSGFSNLNGPPATATTTGAVTLGSGLTGFMRFARVWSRALAATELGNNQRFRTPPEPFASLVMNFPLTSGCASLQNLKGAGIAKPASYVWQDKAYVWDNFVYTLDYRNQNSNLSPGMYTITVKDVFGCDVTEGIQLGVADAVPPVVKFYDRTGAEELYNTIRRSTSMVSIHEPSTAVNTTGDCWFMPFGGELDPRSTDDCGAAVIRQWHNWRGTDALGHLIADTDTLSLNGLAMSGTQSITWYVTDGGNVVDTTVVYIIEDNERPYFNNEAGDVFYSRFVDPGQCSYIVQTGEFVPSIFENCVGYTIVNDYTNSANLNGISLPSGNTYIRWIVSDASNNSDTLYQTINIVDNIKPYANCVETTAYLDADGSTILNVEDLYGSVADGDNCGLSSISIATNVALNKAAWQSSTLAGSFPPCTGSPSASLANDGDPNGDFFACSVSATATGDPNPIWSVNLGTVYDIKAIIVRPRTDGAAPANNLTAYTIEIATDNAFASIVYSASYTGNHRFDIPTAAPINGQYVRIRATGGATIQLAEFEVYGVLSGASTTNVALNKSATMISSYYASAPTNCEKNVPASRAVDGNTYGDMFINPCTVTHTQTRYGSVNPGHDDDWEWWQVNLEGDYKIENIVIWDRIFGPRDDISWNVDRKLYDFYILLANSEGDFPTYAAWTGVGANNNANNHNAAFWAAYPNVKHYYSSGPDFNGNLGVNPWSVVSSVVAELGDTARYVRLWMDHSANELCLAEVQVFGRRVDIPETTINCDQLLGSPVTAIITATDYNNNTTQCDALINVEDNIKPTASPKNLEVPINEDGFAVIRGIDVDNGSYDNCSIRQYLVNQKDSMLISCDSLGIEVSLWFTVVDGSGNRDSVLFDVVLEDNTGPTLIGNTTQPVNLYLNDFGTVTLTRALMLSSLLDPASGDNCGGQDGIVSLTANPPTFVCADRTSNPHTVTITATDYYSNSSTATVQVNVLDTLKPNVRARNATIVVTGVEQPIPIAQINNGSSDNCGIVSMWTNPATIETCTESSMSVILFAQDAAGNVNSDTCLVRFEPALRILSIGMDDCTGGAGANWTANITGTPTTYNWTCLESQNDSNWSTNKIDAFYNPPAASTSTLVSPPYNDQNINNGALRVRLRVSDGVCQAIKIDTLWLFPGAGQPATTFDYEGNECYGTNLTYTVPNAADTYQWSIPVLTSGGGVINGSTTSQSANVTWTRPAGNGNFTGIVQCITGVTEGSGPSAKICYAVYRWTVAVYGTPNPTLTQAGGPIDPFVCPNETVVYSIGNVTSDYTWNWFPPAANRGTVIAGGRNNDPTMTVQWANTNGAYDSIRVTAYNYINCSKTVSSGPVTINDSDPPAFDFDDYEIVVPFIGVAGSTPVQRSCVNITSGQSVTFSPRPTTGGTWSWSGTNVSGTNREQTINNVTSAFSATATYTSPSGLVSTQVFNVSIGGGTTTSRIQGESSNSQYGTINYTTGAVTSVGSTTDGDWVQYNSINLSGGITGFRAHANSPVNDVYINIYINDRPANGGILIGTCPIPNTGTWETWPGAVCIGNITNQVGGVHNIILEFKRIGGGDNLMNLDWFEIDVTNSCVNTNATVYLPNTPNACSAWLTALPVPAAHDICQGTICNSGCYTKTFSINSAPVKTGNEMAFRIQNLNVGTYTVTWSLTDLVGNTNVTPYAYTLVVEDKQAPMFTSYPGDTILYSGDAGCYMVFNEPTTCVGNKLRQTVATDNCSSAITYRREIYRDGILLTQSNWLSNFPIQECSTAPGVGIDTVSFDGGYDYTIKYYARDNNLNVREVPEFTIEVLDHTPPYVTTEGAAANFVAQTANVIPGTCGATVDVSKPVLQNVATAWAKDNCTNSSDLIVTAKRSDDPSGNYTNVSIDQNPFPVGVTTINWFISDLSGNVYNKEQKVTVVDNEAPYMTFANPTVDDTITYCDKDNIRLNIPTLSDYCNKIDSIRVRVTGVAPTVYSFSQKWDGVPPVTQSDILPGLVNGNYRVVWTVWGSGYSRTSSSTPFHVQIQPLITADPTVTNTSCPGASDGSIVIGSIQREPGYTVYYSIAEVGGDQTTNSFDDLPYGPYNYVHITVNGCRSPYRPVSIVQNPPYVISGEITNVWCAEGDTGKINITTTGGYFSTDPDPDFEWYRGTTAGTRLYDGVGGISITTDANRNDDISGLTPGLYTVYYTDASNNCHAQAQFNIFALDNEPPDVTSFPILPSAATNLACVHRVEQDEATRPTEPFTGYTDENLVPYMVDPEGCEFGVQYRLTNEQTSTLWLPSIENLDLIQGDNENRINMQVTQNGNIWEELYEYTISVYDTIRPVPVPGPASGVLSDPVGGGGVVIINADDFNNGSSDNCTAEDDLLFEVRDETTPWGQTVSFDCNDLGDSKTIWLKAEDEAGNVDSVQTSAMTVTDVAGPHFTNLLQSRYVCSTREDANGYFTYMSGLSLLPNSYYDNDNCNPVTLEYRVVSENTSLGVNGVLQEWTEGATGHEGDASYREDGTLLPYYLGNTRVYYRATDNSGNSSAMWHGAGGYQSFLITVYSMPDPGTINNE